MSTVGLLDTPPVRSQYLAEYGPYGSYYVAPVVFTLPLVVGFDDKSSFRGLLVDVSSNNISRWTVFSIPPSYQGGAFVSVGAVLDAHGITSKSLLIGQSDGSWAALHTVNPLSFLSHVVFGESRMVVNRDPMELMRMYTACADILRPNAFRIWTTTYQPTNGVNVRTFGQTVGVESRCPTMDMMIDPTHKEAQSTVTVSVVPEYDVSPTLSERLLSRVLCFKLDLGDTSTWTHVHFRIMLFFWPRALTAGMWQLPWPIGFTEYAIGAVHVTFRPHDTTESSVSVWIDRNFLCRVPCLLSDFIHRVRRGTLPNLVNVLSQDRARHTANEMLMAGCGTTVADYLQLEERICTARKDRTPQPDVPDWYDTVRTKYVPTLSTRDVDFYQRVIDRVYVNGHPPAVDVHGVTMLHKAYNAVIKSLEESEKASRVTSGHPALEVVDDPEHVAPSGKFADADQPVDSMGWINRASRLLSLKERRNYMANLDKITLHYQRTRSISEARLLVREIQTRLWDKADAAVVSTMNIFEATLPDRTTGRILRNVLTMYVNLINDHANCL